MGRLNESLRRSVAVLYSSENRFLTWPAIPRHFSTAQLKITEVYSGYHLQVDLECNAAWQSW